VTDYKTALQSM